MPGLVAIDLPGGEGFVAALQRAWDAGDAALPVDQRLSASVKAELLDRLRPTSVIRPDGSAERRPGQPVEPGDALVVATSGTTGTVKGVVLTSEAVAASAQATTHRLGVDPGRHRWLACLPLSHVGGLSVLTRSLVTGTPCTVMAGFDADEVRDRSGPDVFVSLVTTALRRVGADRFHTVVLGGSAPPEQLPPNVVATYGLTETGSGVVYDGVPLADVEVRIDPSTSEISIKGPMLLRAYRDGTPALEAGGWLRTGDCGRMGFDGRLEVDGRMSELIITGGENVWPAAVEAILRAHPAVADAAVAGRPDPEWGQKVVAWVVPADPAAAPALVALKELVAERIAPYAAPKELILVESLPRTSIGKVRRDRLPPGPP